MPPVVQAIPQTLLTFIYYSNIMLLETYSRILFKGVVIMDYKKIDIDFIINWCQENKQVAWLKAKAKEQVEVKVYPKKKVTRVREDGTTYKTQINDTDKPYTLEKQNISFLELKRDFCEEFMPEVLPKKTEKAPTIWDRIAKL